jgi:acyl dehydratase
MATIEASSFASAQAGDTLPELRLEPINRTVLAYFAGASGDDNPIHIDIDFARAAGMKDVFAHGMLGMAYVGRLLTQWAPQDAVRSFGVRFMAITQLGDQPVLSGKVAERLERHGETLLKLEVQMADQHGELKILGSALVAVAAIA